MKLIMKGLLPLSILLLATTCSCDLLKNIAKGFKKDISIVKNPVDETLATVGFSQCQTVKKIIGVSYEKIEGDSEPNLDLLNLEYQDGDVLQTINIKTASDNLPKKIAPEKNIVIFIHGFVEDPSASSFKTVSDAYLSKGGYNILALDGSSLIRWMYLRATTYVRFMGEKLGEVLAAVVKNGVNPKSIHLVGHSLGSHISGFTGKTFKKLTGQNIGRITGLDPAGPCFSNVDSDLKLKYTDADFVDIIHTDNGVYGLDESIGHVDFFPNGGSRQPSCVLQTCSHARAWSYYAESVQNPDAFQAIKCKNWEEFKKRKCQDDDVVEMGYGTNSTIRGNYYLQTNDESPFGLKDKGLKYKQNTSPALNIGQEVKSIADFATSF